MAQALYLYKPAKVTANAKLEAYKSGRTFDAGINDLLPDIYRTSGTFQPLGPNDAGQIDTQTVPAASFVDAAASGGSGGKNGWPDPPAAAAQQLGVSHDKIVGFVVGAAEQAGG